MSDEARVIGAILAATVWVRCPSLWRVGSSKQDSRAAEYKVSLRGGYLQPGLSHRQGAMLPAWLRLLRACRQMV